MKYASSCPYCSARFYFTATEPGRFRAPCYRCGERIFVELPAGPDARPVVTRTRTAGAAPLPGLGADHPAHTGAWAVQSLGAEPTWVEPIAEDRSSETIAWGAPAVLPDDEPGSGPEPTAADPDDPHERAGDDLLALETGQWALEDRLGAPLPDGPIDHHEDTPSTFRALQAITPELEAVHPDGREVVDPPSEPTLVRTPPPAPPSS